jgi:hypothetical protein
MRATLIFYRWLSAAAKSTDARKQPSARCVGGFQA